MCNSLETEIGQCAKQARRARRWTVEEMAERIGGHLPRTRATIYSFESGSRITWRNVKEISAALGTTPAGLLLLAENMANGMCDQLPAALALIREYRRLAEKMDHESRCYYGLGMCTCIRGLLLAVGKGAE
jgi:transcriptional regulator with XRE-family HTH domain